MKSALVLLLLLTVIFSVEAQWGYPYYGRPYYGGYYGGYRPWGWGYRPYSPVGGAVRGALAGAVIGGLLG
ncbi:sulfur globule protein CV3 domain protein [Ancylostoma duodenale]|uniref:Sulfur globule protein CV3 domain protein n=1 Tax=Ancylostoma duodenale TaxID=51022 RepID=A0A0C2CVQ8_9BILA|nr:sulfur globule protein CV3 domain protein [Ancylostoma duodenale]